MNQETSTWIFHILVTSIILYIYIWLWLQNVVFWWSPEIAGVYGCSSLRSVAYVWLFKPSPYIYILMFMGLLMINTKIWDVKKGISPRNINTNPLGLLNFHVWNAHRWRKSGKGLTGQNSVCKCVCPCQPSLAYWMLEVWGTCSIYVPLLSQWLNFKLFFSWVRALRNSFSNIDGATHFWASKNLVEFKRGLCDFCQRSDHVAGAELGPWGCPPVFGHYVYIYIYIYTHICIYSLVQASGTA